MDYLIPGVGAIIFGATSSNVFPIIAGVADIGPLTAMQAVHVDGWLVVILFWEIALLLFYMIERGAMRSARGRV